MKKTEISTEKTLKKITALWKEGYRKSEYLWIEAHWDYDLPKGYTLFETPAKEGDSIKVEGKNENGEVVTVGYACPLVYVLDGEIYQSIEEVNNLQLQDIDSEDLISCRIEEAARYKQRQIRAIENDCYGD